MEINVEKTKVKRISVGLTLLLTVDHKQLENVQYFKYLVSIIPSNDKR